MKEVMENFNKQTHQRFQEYDDRMKTTRQKCKDKCDKEMKKIILKDKLEKELMEKFATLQADIQNDAIPTCICEKSLADKIEKGCLRCGGVLGGIAPSVGLLGGMGIYSWLNVATTVAIEEAIAAGTKVTIETAVTELNKLIYIYELIGDKLKDILGTITNFRTQTPMVHAVYGAAQKACDSVIIGKGGKNQLYCSMLQQNTSQIFPELGKAGATAITAGNTKKTSVQTAALEKIDTTFLNCSTAITASVIAILIIVLIMVIIYSILRYRRKKKMEKKLQYIKLLEE
ncbi:PIR protein [Plasmodium reichenowi]|uniref:PIR protein n=1 Tax=Plasmodium reichenowi TaxID=5854 RepID=A0A2P9DU39_PLARE|nr:PIR protein [Plasmodium reichenowi]